MLIKKVNVVTLGLDLGPPLRLLALAPLADGSYRVTHCSIAETFDMLTLPTTPFEVITCIPDAQIICKEIAFDQPLNDDAINDLLHQQTSLYFGDYDQELAIDFRNRDTRRVLAIAAPKHLFQPLPDTLNVNAIDIESAAIHRVLRMLYSQQPKTLALILLDSHEIRFIATEDGIAIFKQRAIIQPDISLTIKQHWSLFRTCFPNIITENIYVCGAHPTLYTTVEIIKKIVQIPTLIINPFEKLVLTSDIDNKMGPAFTVACGLASRGCTDE